MDQSTSALIFRRAINKEIECGKLIVLQLNSVGGTNYSTVKGNRIEKKNILTRSLYRKSGAYLKTIKKKLVHFKDLIKLGLVRCTRCKIHSDTILFHSYLLLTYIIRLIIWRLNCMRPELQITSLGSGCSASTMLFPICLGPPRRVPLHVVLDLPSGLLPFITLPDILLPPLPSSIFFFLYIK